jgi:hypothetical protein
MSRADEIASDLTDSVGDGSPTTEQFAQTVAEDMVLSSDELMWAAYRLLDVTQREAADLACTGVKPSQSTASRRMSGMDEEILLEGVRGHAVSHYEEDLQHYPDEVKEAYRDVAARFIIDLAALGHLTDEKATPDWAKGRFPDLSDDTGRKIIKSMEDGDF